MLFQHHRYVAIFLGFCFAADLLFLLKVHWWQSVFFSWFKTIFYVVCKCPVVLRLLVVSILGCFLWGFVVEVSFNDNSFTAVTSKNMID